VLKKQNRLNAIKREKKDTVFSTKNLSIRISESKGSKRFGFIVSKKISGKAVLRNKTKRVLRKAVEEILDKVPEEKNFVITAKKEFGWDKKEETKKEIQKIINK
jgi:ribonuclease P protein component